MKRYIVCWIEPEDVATPFVEEEAILRAKNLKPILFNDKERAKIVAKTLSNKKSIKCYVSEFNANEFNPSCEYFLVK